MCGLNLPIHELPEHVQLHLLEDEGDQGLLGSSPTVTHDDQLGRVQCPLGCGAMVLLEELDSHEEAHRSGLLMLPRHFGLSDMLCCEPWQG